MEAVHPLEIIAFGSRARGEARPDSDLDLLVIMPEQSFSPAERRDRRIMIRRLLADMPFSKDILVADQDYLARERDEPVSVYKAAMLEGVRLWSGDIDELAFQQVCH